MTHRSTAGYDVLLGGASILLAAIYVRLVDGDEAAEAWGRRIGEYVRALLG